MRFTTKMLILLIGLFISNARANQICGLLTSDGWLSENGNLYECLVADNRSDTRTAELMAEYFNEKFSGACLEYLDIQKVSNDLSSLTYCTIETYGCRAEEYYTPDGCKPCGNGNHAGGTDAHNSTKCNYCYNEHYYYSETDDDCYLCPDNGYANDVESPITDCYITQSKTGTDKTGSYEMSDTRCYWTE